MNLLSFSSIGTHEYCCTVIKVPEVKPIEGSDFLGFVEIAGQTIVVRKDKVTAGDIMLYASNECQLSSEFLRVNNLFQDPELNANYELWQSVNEALQKAEDEDEKAVLQQKMKSLSGYFNKTGRVRTIKLKGMQSFGFLFTTNELVKFCPKFKDFDFFAHVDEDFDTVDGQIFVQAYVPYKVEKTFKTADSKKNNRLKRFDTIIPGEFMFHYNTQPLGKNIEKVLKPDHKLVISTKLHGTSIILANVKCKIPKRFSLIRSIGNLLAKIKPLASLHRDDFIVDYRYIWSSRSVIKNRWINKSKSDFYDVDVWGWVADKMKDYVPQGMTVYGEVVGYLPGTQTFIQQKYDYGCKPGECKLMPYRITTSNEDGTKHEWAVEEVRDWTKNLMQELGDATWLIPIEVLWAGETGALFPDLDPEMHFQENAFEEIKTMFGLEKNEPLCKTKVPREGIVIRIEDDPLAEAFKYKSVKFMSHEAAEIDKGAKDMEMQENAAYA